jgi:hypothetical protein
MGPVMLRNYEHKSAPLLGGYAFFIRVVWSVLAAFWVTIFSLIIGAVGYSAYAPCKWIDGLHNAAMILAGMGPVVEIHTFTGKIFSTIYALYCGVVYLAIMSMLLAPFYHRMLHRFHLEDEAAKARQ